jgi:hypothetical protein
MEGFKDDMAQAEAELNEAYDDIKTDARNRLGRLFNPSDYPAEVRGLFEVEWDFPATEPPSYLMRINPEIYEQERQRVAARFDEAVRLAEQAFATEFSRLLSHLSARLANGENGERQIFRDSAVSNLRDFFTRFGRLNIKSNPELDRLVEEANRLVQGISPQDLRDQESLRQHVAGEMAQVQAQVERLIVDAPRRRIVRSRPSGNGAHHDAAS